MFVIMVFHRLPMILSLKVNMESAHVQTSHGQLQKMATFPS